MATPVGPKPGLQRSTAIGKVGGDKAKGPAPTGGKVDRNTAQTNALLRTTDADTKEEREAWLESQKEDVVKELAGAAVTKLTGNLNKKMDKVLASKKQQILKDARTEVETEIQAKAKANAADLKADTLMTESASWDDAVKHAADQSKSKVDAHKAELQSAANDAFQVGPSVSLKKVDRAKNLASVKIAAKRLIDEKAAEIEILLTADVNDAQNQTDFAGAAKDKVAAKAKGVVGDEAKERADADAEVQAAVTKPVEDANKEIHAKTLTYLEKGLGGHGTGWFRSTQFKNFHAKMKEAARDKGHEETDAAITAKGPAQQGHTAEFAYQSTQAHSLTHKAAKLELREIMKEFAGELLADADKQYDVALKLKAPATAAAWGALRDDPKNKSNQGKAGKAAAGAVKAESPKVLAAFHEKAQTLKNEYVKAGGQAPDAVLQAKKNKDVVDTKINPGFDTRTDKAGKKFGERMIHQAMEAPSASKGLQLIGGLIDAAAPQAGNSVELLVELKIPATHGAFCYFTVKGNAQRTEHMELGIEIGFGAGWETWGLSARGGFTVFLNAGAHDSVNAMQMIHYGAFRNLTGVSSNAANFWAGVVDPKETASKTAKEVGKNEQAELWAAMTEERVFGKDDKAFVEVGGGIGGKAALKAGVEGEASGGLTTKLRWDKEVFDKVKSDPTNVHGHDVGSMGDRTGKSRTERHDLAKEKRALVSKHARRINNFKFGASMTLEANGQKFVLGLEATKTFGDPKDAGWEIALSGAIPYDPSQSGSSTLFSKIAASYVPGAIGLVKKAYDAYKANKAPAGHEEGGSPGARIAGGVLDTGEDGLLALDAGGMTNNLLASLASANPQHLAGQQADGTNDTARLWLGEHMGMSKVMGSSGDMTKTVSDAPTAQPFGMTSSLEIGCNLEQKGHEPFKVTFKVSSAKQLKMGGELGAGIGLSAQLTRKQELAGISIGGGEGVKPFMGGRG
jgi:hypothetical protein